MEKGRSVFLFLTYLSNTGLTVSRLFCNSGRFAKNLRREETDTDRMIFAVCQVILLVFKNYVYLCSVSCY